MYLKSPRPQLPKSKLRRFALLLLLAAAIGAAYWAGMERGIFVARTYDHDGPEDWFQEQVPNRLRIAKNSLLGKFSEGERLDIQVGQQSLQRLALKREEALSQGYLMQGPDDFQAATLTYQGQQYPARLRLKGDLLDHLQSEKWSYRVELKGEYSLLGMKHFSLQHPRTRAYLNDWLFQQALGYKGLIHLRYHFLPIRLNGEEMGLYTLEEGFDKRLVEHNERREGVIVKFDERLWWQERLAYSGRPLPGAGHYYSLPFDSFQSGTVAEDSLLNAQYHLATQLLEGFRRGDLTTSQVFDKAQMATFVAMADLFGVGHALHSNQLRFYYNPLTTRLEPIPYDSGALTPLEQLSCALSAYDDSHWTGGGRVLFLQQLFCDTAFFQQYLEQLHQITQPHYLNTLLDSLNPAIDKHLQLLSMEFPNVGFSDEILQKNAQYIRSHLHPIQALRVHVQQTAPHQLVFDVANLQGLPVAWAAFLYRDSLTLSVEGRLWFPQRASQAPLSFQSISATLPQPLSWTDTSYQHLTVHYRLLGDTTVYRQTVEPGPHINQALLTALPREATREALFLHVDDENKLIHIKKGIWQIDEPLVFPAGYQVLAEGGTQLTFQSGAYLLAYSPLQWEGTAEAPIKVFGDSTNGGIFICQTNAPSHFSQVIFSGIAPPALPGWQPTGAVTCYEADASFDHCLFRGIPSEDGLNLVRGTHSLEYCHFLEMGSDGLDMDFVEAKLSNIQFSACQNDGLDASGSRLEVEELTFEGIGDKAMSIGESSFVQGENISVHMARIGLAVKDQSIAKLLHIQLDSCEYGVTLYQKKPEYGMPTAQLYRLQLSRVQHSMLVEKGASLTVDDVIVPSTEKGLSKRLEE